MSKMHYMIGTWKRFWRKSVPINLVLVVFVLIAGLPLGCDLFGSEKDDGVPPTLVEGEYDARYFVRFKDIDAPEGQDPKNEHRGELFCIFRGEDAFWDCQARVGQPVTAAGSYEINDGELVLHDTNPKRANFNWGLSPSGKYDYELDGDTLTLTQGRAGAPDFYSREYHRIVLVRRDTSEYEYLSNRSIDEQTEAVPFNSKPTR